MFRKVDSEHMQAIHGKRQANPKNWQNLESTLANFSQEGQKQAKVLWVGIQENTVNILMIPIHINLCKSFFYL